MGKRNLGNFLIELVDSVGFDRVESIGIVRDADDSAASGLQSIQSHLRNVGLPVPPTFLDSAGDWPIISAFVMPNNAKNGALEALCLEVLQSDPAMDCVAEFFQCVSGVVTDPPKEQDKALTPSCHPAKTRNCAWERPCKEGISLGITRLLMGYPNF